MEGRSYRVVCHNGRRGSAAYANSRSGAVRIAKAFVECYFVANPRTLKKYGSFEAKSRVELVNLVEGKIKYTVTIQRWANIVYVVN